MQRSLRSLHTRMIALALLAVLAPLAITAQAAPTYIYALAGEAGAALQANGTQIAAATYLGGSSADYGRAIGVDAQGNIYVAGDGFSPSMLGIDLNSQGSSDIVVAKLSPDGTQLLGLFSIGSVNSDRVGGMAVTPQGEVILTVETDSTSFPLKNALHTASAEFNSGAMLKINAAMNDLVFSTYTTFTVSYEQRNVAIDGAGNIVVIGYMYNPFGRSRDLVVQKFTPDGQQLLLEKIWDGDWVSERAEALVVRPDGTIYIAGYTEAVTSDLPVTPNAVQQVCGRKLALGDGSDCDDDGFVVRLDPAGNLTYATYLGGNGSDRIVGLGVDNEGAMYVTGTTSAVDFPITAGAFQQTCPTAKPEDGCYYDGFVAKLSPDGSQLVYSTYLGSGDLGGLDYLYGLAVDGQGYATIVGFTASEQWPVKNAIQPALDDFPCPNAFQDRMCFDSVVATFAPDGQLAFSSYLGGKFDELATEVAVGPDGMIYMTGYSESLDFPTTPGVVQPELKSGNDIFVAKLGAGTPPPPAGPHRAFLPFVQR